MEALSKAPQNDPSEELDNQSTDRLSLGQTPRIVTNCGDFSPTMWPVIGSDIGILGAVTRI